jgi:glycosyltransferase involved in cell wall biosynthesis
VSFIDRVAASQRDAATRPIITFVPPWYGPQITGGAEFQCRRTAEELAVRGVSVEVFTTTAGGVTSNWDVPAFAAGSDELNGVPIQRFPVRPRNAAVFDALNRRVLAGERLTLAEEAVFVREIIGSDALEAAIAAGYHERLFLFTPYMFGTSYWGQRAAAGRDFLIPCIHDEGYAHMQLYAQQISHARGLLFYSAAEQQLANRLYQLRPADQCVLGGGVDTTTVGDAARFRAQFGIAGPFLLYAGRRDAGKNTPLLLAYILQYRAAGGPLPLVCIGAGDPIPPHLRERGDVIDLGFVEQQAKLDAYAAATALVQPSTHESFGVVLMEAWVCGTPVLVHSDCAVTRGFVEASGGGLHFRSYAEFVGSLDYLLARPDIAQRMGAAGGAYVRRHFTWDAVLERLLAFLAARI